MTNNKFIMRQTSVIVLSLITVLSLSAVYVLDNALAEDSLIPNWIKGIAGFWIEDKITDQEFIDGLEFLIEEDIIRPDDSKRVQELKAEYEIKLDNQRDEIIELGAKITQLENQIQVLELKRSTPTPAHLIVTGKVDRVIDGNTIIIDDTRIRIPLVDVLDSGNKTAPHAKLAQKVCPQSAAAYYVIDSKQPTDIYGRTIGMVFCNDSTYSLG